MSKEKLFEMARINKDHAEKGTMTLVDEVVKIPAENYYNPERWKKEVDLIFKRLPLVLSVLEKFLYQDLIQVAEEKISTPRLDRQLVLVLLKTNNNAVLRF